MDVTKLVQENFAALAALTGVVIGLIGAWVREWFSKKAEIQQKQMESQKEYVEKHLAIPIITFMDELLQLMDTAYWTAMDGNELDVSEPLQNHRIKQSMIKARVSAFNDNDLIKAFDELSYRYGIFWNKLRNGEKSDAYKERDVAQKTAGIIFERIKPRMKAQ